MILSVIELRVSDWPLSDCEGKLVQMYVNAVVCLCDDFFFNELLKFEVKFVVFVWRDKKQTTKLGASIS